DNGRAHLHSEIHDLADLQRVGLAERAAEDRKVLRKDVDETAINAAVPRDDAVARILLVLHAEIEAAVFNELIDLFECVFIEKQVDALARGEFALGFLLVQTLFAAAEFGGASDLHEALQSIL